MGLIRALPFYLLDLSFLQDEVFASEFLPFLPRHGVVTSQSLFTLFFLKVLVLARGLETGDAPVVALAVTGPDILDAVHDRLLSGSVMPLVSRILYGVPLLLFLSWRVHGTVRSTVPSTRRPTHAIFEMDTESAGSAWPRLDGFASVGQFGRGSYGNKHG